MKIVFDCETDGLLDKLTKIHVFSWSVVGSGVVQSTDNLSVIQHVLQTATTVVGHNIVGFDLPALQMLSSSTPSRSLGT